MTEHKKIVKGIGQVAQGQYKVMVVDAATGEVVQEQPWQKNLILNQGMDQVASRLWGDCYTYGICGQGTSPNTVDSVTDTASQTGTTVTSVGGTVDFTTDAAVGDMIKWDAGSEARITSITSALIVEVTPSQSVGSGQYTIYKTSRVGLQSETKRSNTYLTGAGNCGSTQSGTTIQGRRTYDFTTETGNVTYTEVGVGWASSGTTTVFSRILLNTPVSLVSGQKLRLVYQLDLTLTPSTPNSKNLPIGGWPVAPSTTTDGQECIQSLGISCPNTSGGTQSFNTNSVSSALDPGCTNSTTQGRMFGLSTNSSALAAFGSATSRVTTGYICSVAPTKAAYTPLSFQLDVSTVFQVADAVSNTIRSICMGSRYLSSGQVPYDINGQHFTFLFNENQTKTNTQTLTITVRFTWSRVLA